MTFKAKIHGTIALTENAPSGVSHFVVFTKYRIRLNEDQIGILYLDPYGVRLITDKMEYQFDKILNKDDVKQFSIELKNKLNALDKAIYHLEISWWNKVKANLIHHRYWIDKEKEWFMKTLIAAAVGFIFGLIGAKIGFRQGYDSALKALRQQNQIQAPK